MHEFIALMKEQILNWRLSARMALYKEREQSQTHYLGLAWKIINPLIQVATFFFIFGIGLRGNNQPVGGAPYLVWMLLGMTMWMWVSDGLTNGSSSIFLRINLVSKMRFPISILPMVEILSSLTTFLPMFGLSLVLLFINGIFPTIYWLQFFYYFFSGFIFLLAWGVLNSTVSMVIRDYHLALSAILKVLFYLSGIIVNIEGLEKVSPIPVWVIRLLESNPIYYLIHGVRTSLTGKEWFWQEGQQTLMFWGLTFFVLIIGAHVHYKFRARFVDYI